MKIAAIILLLLASFQPAEAGWKDWFKSDAQKSREAIQGLVDSRRQQTIERYHLLAHAQSVEVLKCILADSQWNPLTKNSQAKPTILVVEYVIRWAGPMNKGGMTRLVSAYDLERQNFPVLREVVLDTNGVSNEDAANAAGTILGLLLNGE